MSYTPGIIQIKNISFYPSGHLREISSKRIVEVSLGDESKITFEICILLLNKDDHTRMRILIKKTEHELTLEDAMKYHLLQLNTHEERMLQTKGSFTIKNREGVEVGSFDIPQKRTFDFHRQSRYSYILSRLDIDLYFRSIETLTINNLEIDFNI